jgi:hypothetical protein
MRSLLVVCSVSALGLWAASARATEPAVPSPTPAAAPATAATGGGGASTSATARPSSGATDELGPRLPPGHVTHGDEPSERVGERPANDGFRERYALETARVTPFVPTKNFLVMSMHGEYELRFRAQSDLRLEAPVRDNTAEAKVLGQNKYLYHWLRLNPRLDIGDSVSFVGQIDVPRGLVVGDLTRYVDAGRDALDAYRWYDVHPRELYLEWRSPIGTFRVGQQASHWGMGILANDGNHPQMFGDTRRGSLTERLLFATRPFGKDTPFIVLAAGDLVFQDNTATLLDGDRAAQGVLAALYRTDWAELGLYGVARHQWRATQAVDALTPFTEKLTVGVVDVTGKIRGKVPGADAYVYGQAEVATIFGGTSFIRSSYANTLDPTAQRDKEKIVSLGAAATLGFVHTQKRAEETWGDIVTELEWGYATGDANPYDGTTHRFTFDTNHHVGLVLFDDVLRWKTARAATIAGDPRLVDRQNPGLQFLPSQGGVFGATYLNPRAIVRPRRWVDVKLGFVIAQASADVVDPYHVGALGSYRNYDGGASKSRDLGFEIDSGVDFRIPIAETVRLELGAEGGILFPGHAFDTETGLGLENQYLLNTKMGMQF